MELTFSLNKSQQNISKHGVSLQDTNKLEWDSLIALEDQRHDYGEVRMIGYALMGTRLFCVVYTDRGAVRRIISLRKANNREKNRYAKVFND